MGCCRDAAAQAARGREREAAEGGCRSEPRQRDAAGRAAPKTLKPVQKRKLVEEMRTERGGSIRRASRVVELTHPPTITDLVAPDRAPLEARTREICQTRCATATGVCTSNCGGRAGLM